MPKFQSTQNGWIDESLMKSVVSLVVSRLRRPSSSGGLTALVGLWTTQLSRTPEAARLFYVIPLSGRYQQHSRVRIVEDFNLRTFKGLPLPDSTRYLRARRSACCSYDYLFSWGISSRRRNREAKSRLGFWEEFFSDSRRVLSLLLLIESVA